MRKGKQLLLFTLEELALKKEAWFAESFGVNDTSNGGARGKEDPKGVCWRNPLGFNFPTNLTFILPKSLYS